MKKNNKFNRALHAIKYGTLGAVAGTILVGGIIIPAGGLAAHGVKYLGDQRLQNYSLKNRFETAYSFNTPESHKYYDSTPVINGYEQDTVKEAYLASPYATYGATGAAGIAGAILLGGAGLALAKRKENQK